MNDTSNAFGSRWKELAAVFLKIGAMSYGGPAIMGIMQAEIQQKRGWLSKERFLEGLALVNMLPGAAATQLGIFIGYDRAGWRGGVLAGLCFMLPAFLIMLGLTLLYTTYGTLPFARHAFYGLGPVVLGIFVVAVCRLGKAALQGPGQVVIAIAAFLAVAFTPFGIIPTLLLAGCAGVALYHARARGLRAMFVVALLVAAFHWGGPALWSQMMPAGDAAVRDAATPGVWEIGAFFFKVGAFTFGGGLTVLAFVENQIVTQLQWLTPQEFLDGLALGQLTPGPILMLAAYVGYKLAGFAGAAVGALAIFAPAFLLMLSVVPALGRVRQLAWIRAAMRGTSAAVIGAISVSLVHLAPHAAPDAFTAVLTMVTITAMFTWNAGPLPMMLGGALIGAGRKLNVLQRLRELA
jgi:chromate transporter